MKWDTPWISLLPAHLILWLTNTSNHFSISCSLSLVKDFFIFKIDNIIFYIDSLHSSLLSSTPDKKNTYSEIFTEFRELSDEDITSLVKSTAIKTCEADPIPSTLLKSSIHILAPVLKELLNTSLATGQFYSAWKRAIIRPKLKKQNREPTLSNYHPLSNLSFVLKLAEKPLLPKKLITSPSMTSFPICSLLIESIIEQKLRSLR